VILRAAQTALVATLALFHLLIAWDNVADFGSNLAFVRHVLSMDTTFAGNRLMDRALTAPALHLAAYCAIIAWEAAAGVLLAWGAARMARTLRAPAACFGAGRDAAVAGLALSLLLWLGGFLTVGGEWFQMWQSAVWNGQQAAGRNFSVVALTLLIVLHPTPQGK
jgi:predicted small integral membrane protein